MSLTTCHWRWMNCDTPMWHIGVSQFIHPSFLNQWVLVLSDNLVFEGHVWCTTASETVNGWGALWQECDWSPSGFDPMAIFSGVVYVAEAALPVDRLQEVISNSNIASEFNRFSVRVPGNAQYGTEEYTTLALLCLIEGCLIGLPVVDYQGLHSLIRGGVHKLQQAPQVVNKYPIVSLKNDNVSFGLRCLD